MATRPTGFDKAKERAKQWLKDRFQRTDLFTCEPGAVDARTTSRIEKATRKLLTLCSNKRLKLKNSPPYLQGILFDTNDFFRRIFSLNTLDTLRDCPYLNLAVRKYLIHCRIATKLFRDAGEEMESEDSEYRRQLNKYTLVFSHMLADLQAVYKDGHLDADFTIVKIDAREFWHRQFGKRLVVPWSELVPIMQAELGLSEKEGPALQHTMDITENNHVSWFEFDVFTRLFQPWSQLINNWYVLALNHPAYKAFITYDEVEAILRHHLHRPGSYVYRLSCTRLGQWAIGFVTRAGKIVQTIPQNKSLYQALLDGVEERLYLYPDGKNVQLDLKRMISDAPQNRVQVTKEEY
nr:Chain A, Ubiquitin Ligase Cbl [Salpingoeca rosetta]